MPFKDPIKQKQYMQQVSINRNIKHDCECGGKYTDKHSAHHKKTKQHRAYLGLPPIVKVKVPKIVIDVPITITKYNKMFSSATTPQRLPSYREGKIQFALIINAPQQTTVVNILGLTGNFAFRFEYQPYEQACVSSNQVWDPKS
jgi:hypothetical protein